MIWDVWDRISYMVQIIIACLVFMVPARKKDHFVLKMIACSLILIFFSYFMNVTDMGEFNRPLFTIYWAYFPMICIPLVWIGLDGLFMGAVYCLMCASAMQHIAYDLYLIVEILFGDVYLIGLLIYVVVYALFFRFMAKKLPTNGEYIVSRKSVFPMITIILIVWILSSLEAFGIPISQEHQMYRIIYRISDLLCCFYVLWVQNNQKEKMSLQRELDGINYAWRQQKDQYAVTKDTIDMINQKCHDLKHQIHALRSVTNEEEKEAYFNEIEDAIMIYDTALKTGNKALDTVLMEKGLFCKNHNIQWSWMADGSKLDFLRFDDIYALFGNALDNAITEVMELDDPKKRIISMNMINKKNLLMIQFQNYCNKRLKFEEGLPVTTKQNKRNHGYGMKSMRHTAEKYNGTITVRTEDHIFTLQILIPLTEG